MLFVINVISILYLQWNDDYLLSLLAKWIPEKETGLSNEHRDKK